MASGVSYIKELRELIAASSSPASIPPHFGVKLREVLPNLLRDYVLPSPNATGRELREVTVLLKLVAFTAQKFPGVFYNGRAALTVVGIVERQGSTKYRQHHCTSSCRVRVRVTVFGHDKELSNMVCWHGGSMCAWRELGCCPHSQHVVFGRDKELFFY
ncbi:hypothetical protein ACP70R_043814 [Stipagrostis hirtigluma subsp. patula]